MGNSIRKDMKNLLKKIKYYFWTKPATEPLKAVDDIQNWMVINYHGQKINMRINEFPRWNAMSRSDKRGMAKRFEVMQKKGQIIFEKINGKEICIRNKNYGQKENA